MDMLFCRLYVDVVCPIAAFQLRVAILFMQLTDVEYAESRGAYYRLRS